MKVILFLLMPILAFSQVEITGKIKDNIEAISFANVVLSDTSNTIVTGTITNDDGTFVLEASPGAYVLTISFLGYKTWTKEITLEAAMPLGDIVLESESANLEEVVVVSKKRLMERKVDRLVFNVDNNVALSGGDAIDALKVSPGVRVQNGEISMIGKSGMKVLIDGRIMQLSGEELTSFLNTIAVDDIKKIEIITNPPAKYEAEGNSGLINIVFKKGARNSWSNAISGSYTQANYAFYNLRNNFTYNKNKVRLLLNVNGKLGDFEEIEDLEVFYPDGLWKTELKRVEEINYLSGRVALDYDFSDNFTAGVQYMGTAIEPDTPDLSTAEIFNASNTLDSLLITKGFNNMNTDTHSLNVHFLAQLDTLERKISVDLDYFDFNSSQDRDFSTNSFSPENVFLNEISNANSQIIQDIRNYSGRIDVEHPFDMVNLSYGGKVSFINNQNQPRFFNIVDGVAIIDRTLSDDFEYDEQVYAGYINASRKITDKLELQLGVRYEYTATEGISKTLNEVNKNDYGKLFPTAYLSYTPNDSNSLSFSYGKRINRPSYSFLNPFRFYVNSNIFSEGNPFLQPSFTDNFEINHSYKRKLITSLYASITDNGFGPVSSVNEETNIQIATRENYYKLYNYGITESYTFNSLSWWESQNSLNVSYSKSDFFNENVDAVEQDGFGWYASTYNTFTLNQSKTLRAQLNFWYSSSYNTILYQNSDSYSMDIALKCNMLKGNLQTTLGVYDIFNSSPPLSTYFVNNVKQTYQMFASNRYARISVSYKFGNKKIQSKERRFGNEDEKRRMGN